MTKEKKVDKINKKYKNVLRIMMIKDKTMFFNKKIIEQENYSNIQSYGHTKKCIILSKKKKNVVYKKDNLKNGVYEYLASKLYCFFNISSAKIKIISSNKELKILSYSVNPDEDKYQFISGIEAAYEVGFSKKNIPFAYKDLNEKEFIEALEFGFAIAEKIIYKNNKKAKKDFEDFKKDFITVVFYDILIDQKDRNLANWGMLKNKVNGRTYLAPLFDNELCYPYSKDNLKYNKFTFNYGYTDLNIVLNVLYDRYYDVIAEHSKKINNHVKRKMINKVKNILWSLSQEYIDNLDIRISEILKFENQRIEKYRRQLNER